MIESTALQPNLDLIELDGRSIYLLGTAHISQASAEQVEQVIRDVRPDSVAVELCDARYQSLRDPERWKNTDIVSVIKQGRIYVLMAQLMLAAFQKRLGSKLHIRPGAEMIRAIEVADDVGSGTVLADRDIRTTLKRTWASLGFWSMGKLIWNVLTSFLLTTEIDEAEIERLKTNDALEELMREFSDAMPEVRRSLIDERDQYLAAKIQAAPGQKVVAVIGAGHVNGIKRWLGQSIDLKPLEQLPPPSRLARIVNWSLFFLVVGILFYGFVQSGGKLTWEMARAWFWITGFAAALGSALALAHPFTVIASFIASPFTTLHPILASGWVAGLVEAAVRKPRVSDFENIADDLLSVRRVLSNRICRILLVIILTNIFGSIGMLIATGTIASML